MLFNRTVKSTFVLPRRPSLITTWASARVRSCCCSLKLTPLCPRTYRLDRSTALVRFRLSRRAFSSTSRRLRRYRVSSRAHSPHCVAIPWDTPSTHKAISLWHARLPAACGLCGGALPLGARSQRPLARPKTPSPCAQAFARSVRRAPSPAPRLPASACPRAPCGAPRGPRPSQRYRR